MAEDSKVPIKKNGIIIGIMALLVVIAIIGTVVFLKTRGNAEATEMAENQNSGSAASSQSLQNNEQSGTDEQNQGQNNVENNNNEGNNTEVQGTQNENVPNVEQDGRNNTSTSQTQNQSARKSRGYSR